MIATVCTLLAPLSDPVSCAKVVQSAGIITALILAALAAAWLIVNPHRLEGDHHGDD